MPAIDPSSLLLVTGATGYIGAMTLVDLLQRGFSVRAAVRNEGGANFILKANASYAESGKLSTVIVPDITSPGAFDAHVKDVAGIVHIASPVTFSFKDPHEDVIRPAVEGTLGILKSAKSHGSKVKRVVITSSVIAQSNGDEKPITTLYPSDWNERSIGIVERDGVKSSPTDVYGASKTIAERSARDWIKSAEVPFDLVTILPAATFGPWVHELKNKNALNSSMGILRLWIFADPPMTPGSMVDVRDIATLHSLALLVEEAKNERIVGNSGSPSTHEALEWLRNEGAPGLPTSIPDELNKRAPYLFDSARTEKVFESVGFKFRSPQVTLGDHAKALAREGVWGPLQ